jgi:hypothetical protein
MRSGGEKDGDQDGVGRGWRRGEGGLSLDRVEGRRKGSGQVSDNIGWLIIPGKLRKMHFVVS